jgi:putative copper resistance protein D
MTENLLLLGQVLCLSLIDFALALLCGLLLAAFWSRGNDEAKRSATSRPASGWPLRWPAVTLLFALCADFWLLTMSMSGQLTPGSILHSMPDVAGTHAGKVALWMLILSVLLVAATLTVPVGASTRVQTFACEAILAAIVFFHSGVGHAAGDGDFTRAELLQFVHLAAMALWTGGVFVSACFALPALDDASASDYANYLRRLSNTSAWCVLAVIVTGALKGWNAIGARLGNLAQPGWSRILLAKLFFVSIALGFGSLHRRKVHNRECQWSAREKRSLVRTLRVEAVGLVFVMLLSAWLSNLDPPQ